jgi:hypothetical protein
MFVNGKKSIDEIDAKDLVAEGRRWGLRWEEAEDAVAKVLLAAPDAIERAAAKVEGCPKELVKMVEGRAKTLRRSLGLGRRIEKRGSGPERTPAL